VSVPTVIFTALSGLVANRCYPATFPQPPALPVWPSIRYTLSTNDTAPALCGTGDEDEDDIGVQIDVVAETHADMIALKAQVITALMALKCAREPGGFEIYDAETKTHRAVLQYLFQQ
jgi:Protein of unknown function (DUF3168)